MDRMISPGPARTRVAVISLHTSPLDQPGTGDSGGMNVYVKAVAERLAEHEIGIDVFTRCAGRGVPEVEHTGPLTRVIQIPAGPCAPVAKIELPALLPAFAGQVLTPGNGDGPPYDLIHSHYWLSGAVGRRAKARWGVPLVASFHTLGRVKNLALAEDELPEPRERLAGEQETIQAADRILAPTSAEAVHLEGLYGAPPGRIRVVPPGVDADLFRPGPREQAKAALGLAGHRVVLFLGRLQRFKGPDVAIRAVREAFRRDPQGTEEVMLVVVGGPSGPDGPAEAARLMRLAGELGLGDRVRFLPPRLHHELPEVYASADVLLMPSRSESFGLVALEAQACGVPVVASAVGGLRTVVDDGGSGFLVPGNDPAGFADRLLTVLSDRALADRLARGAVAHAIRFTWEDTVAELLGVYGELVPALAPVGAID
jgi:D-inositol-3-phosphate glycosyltransferase